MFLVLKEEWQVEGVMLLTIDWETSEKASDRVQVVTVAAGCQITCRCYIDHTSVYSFRKTYWTSVSSLYPQLFFSLTLNIS